MRVWVAVITHRHGNDVRVALSRPEVLAEVYEYVEENWHEVLDDDEIPKNRKEAIERYFEATDGDEWCDIDFQDVRPRKKKKNGA